MAHYFKPFELQSPVFGLSQKKQSHAKPQRAQSKKKQLSNHTMHLTGKGIYLYKNLNFFANFAALRDKLPFKVIFSCICSYLMTCLDFILNQLLGYNYIADCKYKEKS